MANTDFRLTTNRFVRPGTFIGFVPIPRPVVTTGTPRLPCFIGKGNRLALVDNLEHRRSFYQISS